jgi:putative membrane protein
MRAAIASLTTVRPRPADVGDADGQDEDSTVWGEPSHEHAGLHRIQFAAGQAFMMRVLVRLLINAAALWTATRLVGGISFDGDWRLLFAVALVFGLVNVLVRPVVKLLTLPLLILTLGLFTLVVNALMLHLTDGLSDALGLGFHVAGFWPAFWGGLVISIVSFALNIFVGPTGRPDDEWRGRQRHANV